MDDFRQNNPSFQPARRAGYSPGWLAKVSVGVLGILLVADIWRAAGAGVDVTQGAILWIVGPLLFALPAYGVAHLAYFIAGKSNRAGDIAFATALAATVLAIFLAHEF